MNTITVVGNLVKEVDFKYLENEKSTPVANFVIADNGYRNGEKTVKFWRCVMFGQQAEGFANNFMKGREYTVKGEVQEVSYVDMDGVKHTYDQLLAQAIQNGRKPKQKEENGSAPAESSK